MNKKRFSLIIPVLLLGLVLAACTSAPSTTWPGVTATQDVAYVAFGNGVFAVNTSGSLKWRFPDKAVNGENFYAAPSLGADGLIVVGDFSSKLFGIDQNGHQKWEFDGAKSGYLASPLITKDRIYAPNNDGKLYVLDLSGNLQWTYATKASLWAQPAIDDNGILYLSAMDHNLYAIKTTDHAKLWTTDLGGAINGGPVLGSDGFVYVGTLGKEVMAVNTKDGSIAWRHPTTDGVWSKLVLDNGKLIFGDISGKVYAVNSKDGTEAWSKSIGLGLITSSPAVLADGYVFTTENASVFKVDQKGNNQSINPSTKINGKLYSTPLYVGGQLLIGEMDGDALLVALKPNGEQSWSFVAPK